MKGKRPALPGREEIEQAKASASAQAPSSAVLFVHSALDDYGLRPGEFRVLGHISRRAGKSGRCYASQRTMAAACRMNVKTVQKSIRELVRRRIISEEIRPGRTTIYWINPRSQWRPPPNQATPKTGTAPTKDQGVRPKLGEPPHPKEADKGNPHKGNPIEGEKPRLKGKPTSSLSCQPLPSQLPELIREQKALIRVTPDDDPALPDYYGRLWDYEGQLHGAPRTKRREAKARPTLPAWNDSTPHERVEELTAEAHKAVDDAPVPVVGRRRRV